MSPEPQKTYGALTSGFAVAPGLMRVESRGAMRLASADPMATPSIQPRLPGTDNDLTAMVRGVESRKNLGR